MAAEGFPPRFLLLLIVALGGVLPIELGADQFKVAGAHRWPVQERLHNFALIGQGGH